MLAGIFLEMNEQTKGHFKKTKVGDYEYLVLEPRRRHDPLGRRCRWTSSRNWKPKRATPRRSSTGSRKSKLTVAVGVRDNYLLASIGPSLDCLEKLGKGERLIDRAEFKPLEKYADQAAAVHRLRQRRDARTS